MGLDMYLRREIYVKHWDFKGEDNHQITVKRAGKVRQDIDPKKISYVIEEVAYWRKANAIHKWFVEVVQGGVDECQESYVTKEQIAQLVGLCKRVLGTVETVDGTIKEGTTYHGDGRVEHHTRTGPVVAQKQIAAETLPTQAGFFFGNTDYDQYYLQDLKDTVEMLEPLLELEDCDLYYQASW